MNFKDYIRKLKEEAERVRQINEELKAELKEIEDRKTINNAEAIANRRTI